MAINSASWRKDKGSSSERGYTWAWTKARNAYLRDNPLCVMCKAMKPSRVTAANVVDHIVPHQGNQELFWDESNWQSLCRRHHDTDKAEQEGRHKAKAKFDSEGCVVW
jgi:5-methylcytosine-specific restriction endonuclease McrA